MNAGSEQSTTLPVGQHNGTEWPQIPQNGCIRRDKEGQPVSSGPPLIRAQIVMAFMSLQQFQGKKYPQVALVTGSVNTPE